LVNWVSLAAADAVFVNSRFHLDALVAALPGVLARGPDHDHRSMLAAVEARLSVLPVGVVVGGLVGADRLVHDGHPRVLWNQRWEHDKDPATFLRALCDLADEGVDFEVVLAGENVRVDPQEFERARAHLGARVVHVGHLPEDEYRQMLRGSDVVVSTARHEFFGIAMIEAMAAGAVPLLPDRLSYPELVPSSFHEAVLYRDAELVDRLRTVLCDIDRARAAVEGLADAMSSFAWEVVAPRYDQCLVRVVDDYRPIP
jgi:glycosyltransferase involved in cell wall biosynthesis